MSNSDKGWSWFERARNTSHSPSSEDEAHGEMLDGNADTHSNPDRELCLAYARCFGTAEGQKVLKHMRAITLERSFGPSVPAQTLRHAEGQRQLVTYISSLVQRGRDGG